MYTLFAYVRHLLTSTNQHGVHSPFVYNYITKCLYTRSKYKASKSQKAALKSISYFKMQRIKLVPTDAQMEKMIQKELHLKVSDAHPFDFIYANYPSFDLLTNHKEQIHNDSMFLINNIHNSKSNAANWKVLKQHKAVTVSIDMFHCGALFFREEQVKEHFKIRI